MDVLQLSELANALWQDPQEGIPAAADTVATVSLLNLSSEEAIERAAKGILDHAVRRPPRRTPDSYFFRLLPEERLVLAALHYARWSYGRLARILGLTENQVAELAWGARLQLATSAAPEKRTMFPTASSGASCPEYHPGRPWTQRFLDEESSPQERAFLQSHLESCASCLVALNRARTFYFDVQALVPRLNAPQAGVWNQQLGRVHRRSTRLRPHDVTFVESLQALFRRWDMRVLAACAGIWILTKIFS
jgi:hypothetical protein